MKTRYRLPEGYLPSKRLRKNSLSPFLNYALVRPRSSAPTFQSDQSLQLTRGLMGLVALSSPAMKLPTLQPSPLHWARPMGAQLENRHEEHL